MFKKLSVLIFVVCIALVVSPGCKERVEEDPQTRGITEDTIRIGQVGPLTGPASLWGAVARGSGVYFDMINEEGGIHGRKIEYFMRDDGYLPHRTRTQVTGLVENQKVFAMMGGVGTATGMAVRDYLTERQVPWVHPCTPSYHWSIPLNRHIFSIYPLASTENMVLIDYVVDQLDMKKIAVIYQNDDYGLFGLHSAAVHLESKGLELAGSVSVEATDTDLSSHAMRLRDTGAEAVLLWLMPSHGATIVGQADMIGYNPQWLTSSTLSDMEIMYNITGGLWKDVIIGNAIQQPTSGHPLVQKYREATDKYNPNERFGVFYLAGFFFAESMVEALKKAGPDLTVDKFIEAMESIEDFQGIGPPLTYTETQRQAGNAIFLTRCISATESEKLTDWRYAEMDLDEVLRRMKK